jgi:ABC-type uncharacterized transport system substrate-binding protein
LPFTQQANRIPLIAAITPLSEDDPEAQARVAAFRQALQDLGWIVGRNVRIEYRWGASDPGRTRKIVAELLALSPDIVFATGSPTLEPFLQATHTVPIRLPGATPVRTTARTPPLPAET